MMKIPFLAILLFISSIPLLAGQTEAIVKKAMLPAYPACAIEQRVQGVIQIKASLNPEGYVIQAVPVGKLDEPVNFPELKSDTQFAYQCLCKSAQKAAYGWQFEKVPKSGTVVLLFRFELVGEIPCGEELYPVYIAPFEVHIRGLLPSCSVSATVPAR